MDNIQKILEYAMHMELDAKEFYTYNLERVDSPSLKKLFEELIEMEEGHYAVLKLMHERLNVLEPPITISWVVDNAAAIVNTGIIADNSDFISNPKTVTDLSLVRLAYLMESDFALFYKNAAEHVENKEAKKFLLNLSDWETQHEKMFKEKYHSMLKQNWNDITDVILK